MRRFLKIIPLVLLLAGCADLAKLIPTPEESGPELSAQGVPTAEAFPQEITTAARIAERGELIVGVRYDLEPFSYIAEDSMLAGLEIDLARELARRWLGDADAVQFRQVRTDTAMEHLQAGTVDIVLAGVPHTQQAETGADFSPAYFMNGLALLTYPDSGINGLGDLGGRNTGILDWTESASTLAATATVTPTTVAYENFFDVIEALSTRQIDVYADQRHRLERARRLVSGTHIVGQATQEPIAMMYRENDPFFANLVLTTFQAMASEGQWQELYARWLPDTPPPALPAWPGTAAVPSFAATPQERYTGNMVEGIKQRGVVEVGYFPNRWPYSADREDGVQTGFEARMLERMVELWLGTRQSVTFIPVDETTGPQMLENGELDMLIGGWIHTMDGEMRFDFSDPIYDDGVGIFSSASAPIQSLDELAGQPVGVIAGSAGEAALPALSQTAGVGLSPVVYPDRDSAVAALEQGEITAIISERLHLLDPLYRKGGFFLTDTRFTYRPVAFILPQGDSAFRDLVNLTLATLRANGSYAEIYGTWFDDPVPDAAPWPGSPSIPLSLQ